MAPPGGSVLDSTQRKLSCANFSLREGSIALAVAQNKAALCRIAQQAFHSSPLPRPPAARPPAESNSLRSHPTSGRNVDQDSPELSDHQSLQQSILSPSGQSLLRFAR